MLTVVGLGNPGPEYCLNRHNIGFMAVDFFAEHFDFSPAKVKGSLFVREGVVQGQKITFLKPLSYMNRSGIPVAEFVNFYKIPLDQVIVIHDDLDLEPGKVRMKQGGGAGGHNGLRSLDAHMGQDYWRLRLGIGHPGHKDQVAHYVLQNFAKSDENWLTDLMIDLCACFPLVLAKDGPALTNELALRRKG